MWDESVPWVGVAGAAALVPDTRAGVPLGSRSSEPEEQDVLAVPARKRI